MPINDQARQTNRIINTLGEKIIDSLNKTLLSKDSLIGGNIVSIFSREKRKCCYGGAELNVPRRATGAFPRETKLSRCVYAHIPTQATVGIRICIQ